MDSYNKMLVLDESDMNYQSLEYYKRGILHLNDIGMPNFTIDRDHMYKASVVMFKCTYSTDRKLLKNRFGKGE
jgi:hypothetical protein